MLVVRLPAASSRLPSGRSGYGADIPSSIRRKSILSSVAWMQTGPLYERAARTSTNSTIAGSNCAGLYV